MRLLGVWCPIEAAWLLARSILLATAVAGCAAKEKVRQGQSMRREVVPPAVQVAAQEARGGPALVREERTSLSHPTPAAMGVQLASFQQPATPGGGPAQAEIVAVPHATLLDQDRTTIPLDLATALGMTQGQNPRV